MMESTLQAQTGYQTPKTRKEKEGQRTCAICGFQGKFGSLFAKDTEIVEEDYRTPTGNEGIRYSCKDVSACLDRVEASIVRGK